jgi:hypothetical protein
MARKKPDPTIRRLSDKGPLHDLLLKACPPDAEGVKSIPVLARAMKLSPWAIYRWIENARITPDRANEVVKLSKGGVTLEEFYPHIFKAA